VKARRRGRGSGLLVLAVLTLSAVAIAAGIWHFAADAAPPPPAPSPKEQPAKRAAFDFDGIDRALGVTLAEARRAYPDITISRTRRGEPVATARRGDVRHTLWFVADGPRDPAYRVRLQKTVGEAPDGAALGRIGRRLGHMVYQDCGRQISTARRLCHFRWAGRKGVVYDIFTHDLRGGGTRTQLTVIATDTRLESQRFRAGLGRGVPLRLMAQKD
jgi:hypothetical protein